MARSGCRTVAPTLEELKAVMKKRYALGMVTALTLLPNLLIDKSEAVSIQEMAREDGSIDNPAYRGKLFRKVIAKRLEIFDEMGLLD